jgi:ATP-dependent DNA helicase RecQ
MHNGGNAGLDSVLFFDLETGKPDSTISNIGALLAAGQLHGPSVDKFASFGSDASHLCGHNIVAHDLPALRKYDAAAVLLEKPIIDTLLLSPLLFPRKPYHRLIKDYKLFDGKSGKNDPVYDSMLCRELLVDEIDEFNRLESSVQNLYWSLLKGQEGFSGFFSLLGFTENEADVVGLYHELLEDSICLTKDLEKIFSESPVAAAYCFAFIKFGCPESIIPSWALKNIPMIQETMSALRSELCSDEKCPYCSRRRDLRASLKNHFGFDGFRRFSPDEKVPAQETAVRWALENRSFVAVFPTGEASPSPSSFRPSWLARQAADSLLSYPPSLP